MEFLCEMYKHLTGWVKTRKVGAINSYVETVAKVFWEPSSYSYSAAHSKTICGFSQPFIKIHSIAANDNTSHMSYNNIVECFVMTCCSFNCRTMTAICRIFH